MLTLPLGGAESLARVLSFSSREKARFSKLFFSESFCLILFFCISRNFAAVHGGVKIDNQISDTPKAVQPHQLSGKLHGGWKASNFQMSFNPEKRPGATDVLRMKQPLRENLSDPSFAINSFYSRKNKTFVNRKLPFYLRYAQSCNKESSQEEVTATGQQDPLDTPDLDSDGENQLPKPVSSKRPCYYQEPSELKKYIASLKPPIHHPKKPNDSSQALRTPSPLSHSGSTERKFFKNRSASLPTDSEGNAATGATVIKQGFNYSFVPRRLSSSFDKRITRPRKPSSKKRKRTYSKNNQIVEQPLSPLSKIFPELDLESSPASSTELSAMTQIEDSANDQTSQSQKEDMSWSVLLTPAKDTNDVSISSSTSSPCVSAASESESPPVQSQKFYSVFSNRNKGQARLCLVPPSESSILIPRFIKDSEDLRQMTLDAGQKKFGAIQCPQCGMVYTQADPLDETTHAKFHHSVLAILRFPGWKKERIIQEYIELGSRVIMVRPDDKKHALQKVKEINQMMSQELGFPDAALSFSRNYKVFLYISEEKRIEGCCVAESITKGYRVIPNSSTTVCGGRRPWCCEMEPEPAAIGISKIWVYGPSRRTGIASKMLDCVRFWFEYGIPVERNQLAFSDPTPDGMQMATKYTGSPAFLVYKCRLK